MQELKKQGLKAFVWDFSGKFLNQGINFIISILLARLLEPKDFGTIAMVMVFISLTQSFIDFGLGVALIQRKDSTDEQFSTVFYVNILLGCLLTIMMFSCAPLIALYYNMPEITPIAHVLSFMFIINSVNVVQNAQLIKMMDFAGLTKRNIFSSFISGGIGVLLAFKGFGIWSLVFRSIFSSLLQAIFIWTYSKWRPLWQFNLRSIGEHWKYSYKMFLSGILNTIFDKIDVLVIGKLFSASQLGFYYRAQTFNHLIIRYSSDSLTKVLFPVISNIQDDRQRISLLVIKSLHVIGFIVFGMIGVFFLVGEDLIILLFGMKWLPAVPYFKIMLFYAYAYPISAILVNVISGLGNSKAFLNLEIKKRILLAIAIPIGFIFGIEGYLWAIVGSVFLAVLLNMHFVHKEIAISILNQLNSITPYAILAFLITVILNKLKAVLSLNYIADLVTWSTLFAFLYFGFNLFLKTKGLKTSIELAIEVKKRLFKEENV